MGRLYNVRMRRKAIGLAAALVLLSFITVAVAQSRRTQPPAMEQATRALIEGRYDQVAALLEKLDAQDPTVAALVARADIARGRYAEAEAALRPIAQRAPTSEAALELGLLLKMLGRADATAILTRVAAVAEHRDRRDGSRARRPRAARARTIPGGERRLPRRRVRCAPRSGDPHGVGRAVPREVQQARGAEVVSDGAQARSALGAGAPRLGAHARRRESAAGDRAREDGARDQPVGRRRPRVPRRRGGRRRPPRRGAQVAAEGARRQSVEPRGARAARRARLRRGQDRRVRGRGRQGARHRARTTARCTASPASWRRTTTASTKR